MENRRSNDVDEDLSEIIKSLHEKSRIILSNTASAPVHHQSVISQGGEPPAVQTSYLTGATGFQNTLINHHMQSLIRNGLVEKIEKLPSTDPRSHPGSLGENVYQCTENGVQAAEQLEEQPVGESFDSIRAEVERQREKLKRTNQLMMRIAVNTDTLTLEQAEKMMSPDEFEEVFGEDALEK